MNSSNIEAKFGTIGFLAFIYLLFSESIKEDSVPLIIQNELKFETMLTPLFAECSISFSPLIGCLIAVTLPLIFIILVDPSSSFGPAFAVSSFSFVSLLLIPANQFIVFGYGILLLLTYSSLKCVNFLMDVSYIFISLEIISAMSPWLSPLQIAILPLIVLFQLKLLSSNMKFPVRKGYQRFFMPAVMTSFLLSVICPVYNYRSAFTEIGWQVFDVFIPFTCPTAPAFKIPIMLLVIQLLTSGYKKLEKNFNYAQYSKIIFFLSLITSSCFHADLLKHSKLKFDLIRASNERINHNLWRKASENFEHAITDNEKRLLSLSIVESRRLEQINFFDRIQRHPDSTQLMINISKKTENVGLYEQNRISEYWAQRALAHSDTPLVKENLALIWAVDYEENFGKIKELLTSSIKTLDILNTIMTDHNERNGYLDILSELKQFKYEDSAEFDWYHFRVYYQDQNFLKALYPLMALVKRNPHEYRARIGIAAILHKLAETEKQKHDAIGHLTDVLDMQPDNIEAECQLGFILASNKQKNFILAAKHLKKAHSRLDSNKYVLREYARVLHEVGTTDEIQNILPELVDLVENDEENLIEPLPSRTPYELFELLLPKFDTGRTWMLVASLASKIQDYQLAEKAYKHAGPLLESQNSVLSELGICINFVDQHNFAKAKECVYGLLSKPEYSDIEKLKKLPAAIDQMSNMMSNTQENGEQEIGEEDILKSNDAVENSDIENDSSETKEDDSRQNETEMKEALKKLMNLQKKKQKTNSLVSELDDIKSILHAELQNMAATEVNAFRSAALKKLEKIKYILNNK